MHIFDSNILNHKRTGLFIFLFLLGLLVSLTIFYFYIGLPDFHFPLADSLTFDYPLRFFISSAMQHGIFPLWDQWRKNGSSLSATIISYNFSPIILFFSLFGVYTLQTFIVEMLFVQVICFVGMFLWLKTYCNKWIALYGAFCFSISSPIVSTTGHSAILMNMSFIPLTAYGVKMVLRGSYRYIGIVALLLVTDFTSGYLGTNIMFLPLIFLYCFLEFFLYDLKGHVAENKARIQHAITGIVMIAVLFFALTLFQWLDAWNFTKFNYTSLRTYGFDPFDGATSFKSLVTLFFTHNFPSYIRFSKIMSAPGVTSMIYFGLLNLAFFIYGLLNRKTLQNSLLLFFFIILAFFLSLYKYHPVQHILEAIPFLKMTRWHGWYSALIVFFEITLSSPGMNYFFTNLNRRETKKLLISQLAVLFSMVGTAIFILVKSSSHANFFPYFMYQVTLFGFITAVTGFAFFVVEKKKQLLICILIIVSLGLIEYVFNAMQYLTPRDIWTFKERSIQTVQQFEKLANSTFARTTNERTFAFVEPLITQIPSYGGYTQFDDPAMQRLKKSVGQTMYVALTKYIFYSPDSSHKPDREKNKYIAIKKFYPNEIDLTVTSKTDNQPIVWSSPYTSFWKLFINGREQQTTRSNYGLTAFSAKRGVNNVVLVYHPNYFEYSMAILLVSYLLVIWLIVTNKTYYLPKKL